MSHPHSRTGLYDEIDRLQAGLTTMIKRFHEVVADRDEWKQQHENLLEVHRSDLAALAAKLKASVPTEEQALIADLRQSLDEAVDALSQINRVLRNYAKDDTPPSPQRRKTVQDYPEQLAAFEKFWTAKHATDSYYATQPRDRAVAIDAWNAAMSQGKI